MMLLAIGPLFNIAKGAFLGEDYIAFFYLNGNVLLDKIAEPVDGIVSASEIKKLAKKYNATVTEFIASLLMLSILLLYSSSLSSLIYLLLFISLL